MCTKIEGSKPSLFVTIPFQAVSKKNSKRVCRRMGSRASIIASTAWMRYEKAAHVYLMSIPKTQIVHCDYVIVKHYFKDRRLRDLTNATEGVLDVLVDCGFFSDDNYKVIPKVIIEFGGYDKEKPRSEVSAFGCYNIVS